MIIAVDKGTTFTKTEKISFKSTIREYRSDEIDFAQDKIMVEYNNKKYIIGEKGKTNTNLFKSHQEETKLLILAALALENQLETRQKVRLITGLPIGRYAVEKEHMKKLFQHTKNEIIVNKQKYFIDIADAEIFPEGASSFYSIDVDEGLIIDIGGLSIDMALFDKEKILTKYSTHKLGIMPLYRQIANKVNNKYSLSLDEWEIENKIKNGITIDGVNTELEMDGIINEHIQLILQSIEFEYDIPIIKHIFLTGGGSKLLYSYFKRKIPRVQLMPNPQYTNVIAYSVLGRVLFNEKG